MPTNQKNQFAFVKLDANNIEKLSAHFGREFRTNNEVREAILSLIDNPPEIQSNSIVSALDYDLLLHRLKADLTDTNNGQNNIGNLEGSVAGNKNLYLEAKKKRPLIALPRKYDTEEFLITKRSNNRIYLRNTTFWAFAILVSRFSNGNSVIETTVQELVNELDSVYSQYYMPLYVNKGNKSSPVDWKYAIQVYSYERDDKVIVGSSAGLYCYIEDDCVFYEISDSLMKDYNDIKNYLVSNVEGYGWLAAQGDHREDDKADETQLNGSKLEFIDFSIEAKP